MEIFLKLNTAGRIVYRNFTISTFLNIKKQNRYQMKRKSEDKPVKTDVHADLKAEKNREVWVKLKEEDNLVKGKFCNDDVYFVNGYEQLVYPLKDAIGFHQEYLLDAAMLHFPKSVLKANFILNMKTNKSTKFISRLNGVVIPTNMLDFLSKPKIVAFCMTPEDVEMCLQLGAYKAGNEDLVKNLKQGLLFYEEFDQVVCHTDAVPVVSKLKSVLRDKLPLGENKRISSDLKQLVETYVNGFEFKSKKIEGIPEEAEIVLPLGEINWPIEKLMENFEGYFKTIVEMSTTSVDGHPISKVTLSCPPSDEVFRVNCEEFMKTYVVKKSKKAEKNL